MATRKTTSRRKTVKADVKRSTGMLDVSRLLLEEISRSIKTLNSTPNNSDDPGFAYGVRVSELADAFSHTCPQSPVEALAHACMLFSEINLMEATEHSEYQLRLALHRMKLRAFWLAGWIENEHGIQRDVYNLDYFHDITTGYRQCFPHQSDAELSADLRLDEMVKKEAASKKAA